MKYLDDVKVTANREYYNKNHVFKGSIGTIIFAEIRDNAFEVVFSKPDGADYAEIEINVSDLELVKENKIADSAILDALPQKNPKWWCKVENGYIMNLLGEKKNKIPYDYNS